MKNTLETFPPVLHVWRSNILSEKVAKLASRAFLFFFYTAVEGFRRSYQPIRWSQINNFQDQSTNKLCQNPLTP